MFILLILLFVLVFALQVPGLVKKKLWKELIIYISIYSLGVLYSLGLMFDLKLPNPMKKIEILFASLWDYLQNIIP